MILWLVNSSNCIFKYCHLKLTLKFNKYLYTNVCTGIWGGWNDTILHMLLWSTLCVYSSVSLVLIFSHGHSATFRVVLFCWAIFMIRQFFWMSNLLNLAVCPSGVTFCLNSICSRGLLMTFLFQRPLRSLNIVMSSLSLFSRLNSTSHDNLLCKSYFKSYLSSLLWNRWKESKSRNAQFRNKYNFPFSLAVHWHCFSFGKPPSSSEPFHQTLFTLWYTAVIGAACCTKSKSFMSE